MNLILKILSFSPLKVKSLAKLACEQIKKNMQLWTETAVLVIKFALTPKWLSIFEMSRSVIRNFSMYEMKTLHRGKCLNDIYSLVAMHNTHSFLDSIDRNSRMKILRALFLWNNLDIFHPRIKINFSLKRKLDKTSKYSLKCNLNCTAVYFSPSVDQSPKRTEGVALPRSRVCFIPSSSPAPIPSPPAPPPPLPPPSECLCIAAASLIAVH